MSKRILNNKINEKKQEFIIIYADIETLLIDKIHNPYAIGWNYKGEFKHIYANNIKEVKERIVIKKFLEQITNIQENNILIIFHNMSNFDGFFILNYLLKNIKPNIVERDNTIYQINFSLKKKNVYIRDSLLLIPMSLKKIGETLTDISKKNYDIANINNKNFLINKKDILNYLKYDVLVLEEGYKNFSKLIFNKFNYNINNSLSLSSISFNIFRKIYYDVDKYPICKNDQEEDFFIRKSYIGGMTDVYKPYLENGYYYDINSLYPFCMTKELPIGRGKWRGYLKDQNIDDLYGFINCDIITPKNIEVPFLPKIDYKNDMVLTPLGKWNGTYFSEELKEAKKLGYHIKPIKGFIYEKGFPLKKFVDDLYELRKTYPKTNPMNTIVKLILNSLYGRFGMQINPIRTKLIKKIDLIDYKKKYTVIYRKTIDENHYYILYLNNNGVLENIKRSKREIMKALDINTAVHIASAVTAYARIEIYKYKKENCFYTDTDSVFTNRELDPSLIGDELGQMKLECKIKEGYFIAPKNYLYINDKGNKKVVFKGVKNEFKETLEPDFYKSIIRGEKKTFKWKRINYFKKDFKNIEIIQTENEIENIIPFNKRDKVFDDKGNWINTIPKKINEKWSKDIFFDKY